MIAPRGYVFIGLNIIRLLSIIGLLLVFASSIFVLVTDIEAFNDFTKAKQAGDITAEALSDCDYIDASTVPNQAAGIFWAVVNRLFIIFQVIILILAEIGWPSRFFERFFPVLGPNFGLGALGIFQCLIGAAILSHHTDDFTLVSAFFLFSIGCLNMVVGLIFREKAKARRCILTWRNESKEVLPSVNDSRAFMRSPTPTVKPMFTGSSFASEKVGEGFGYGRQGEKAAGLKGFLLSKPLETLPRYAPPPRPETHQTVPSQYSQDSPQRPAFQSSTTAI